MPAMTSLIEAQKVLARLRAGLNDHCNHPVLAVRLSASDMPIEECDASQGACASLLIVFGDGWVEGVELSGVDFEASADDLASQIAAMLDQRAPGEQPSSEVFEDPPVIG